MMARTAAEMRAHLDDFSGKLSSGSSKPARRLVSGSLYGIAARGSVRLGEIERALEETIALAKTATRLSRNLGRPALRAHLGVAALRMGGVRIGARALLVLDISDSAKPTAGPPESVTYSAACGLEPRRCRCKSRISPAILSPRGVWPSSKKRTILSA